MKKLKILYERSRWRIQIYMIIATLVAENSNKQPLPNHMYFETDFKVFKMYFQYLNTILLYFNPI